MLSACLPRQRESLRGVFEIICSTSAFVEDGIFQMPVNRLNELDALRGLMLVLMTLTHLPTRLSSPLGQPFGYVSAAEGFVLLSAYMAGLVYGRTAQQKGIDAMAGAFCANVLCAWAQACAKSCVSTGDLWVAPRSVRSLSSCLRYLPSLTQDERVAAKALRDLPQSRAVPGNLRPHLCRCRAAQCISGVQRAAQAENVIHVFVNFWMELLQHR